MEETLSPSLLVWRMESTSDMLIIVFLTDTEEPSGWADRTGSACSCIRCRFSDAEVVDQKATAYSRNHTTLSCGLRDFSTYSERFVSKTLITSASSGSGDWRVTGWNRIW